ncbi:MAG: hypothetical protein Tsb0020_39800 [Haliangiales bacterium]
MSKSYRYRFSVWWALFAMVFFGACAALFTHKLLYNQVGVIINGVIELGPSGASLLYGVLAAASWLFVAGGLAGLLMPARQLTISEHGLDIPTGFLGRKQRQVAWSEVRAIEETNVSGTRILTLRLERGKVGINNRMLAGNAVYEQVTAELRAAVAAQTGQT